MRKLLDEMRLIKDAHELDVMRRAARISANAHRRAMRHTRPGLYEYEIEAELLHEFRSHGAQAPAYTPIVAGGANACVLHYVANDAAAAGRRPAADRCRLRAGRLCLRHHAHLPCQRSLQRRAARRLRAGAGRAGGRHRARYARATPGRTRTTRPCACWCRASSTWGCSQGSVERPDRVRRLPPLLHAPHRPLAGHGRARLRRLQARRALARRSRRAWC